MWTCLRSKGAIFSDKNNIYFAWMLGCDERKKTLITKLLLLYSGKVSYV